MEPRVAGVGELTPGGALAAALDGLCLADVASTGLVELLPAFERVVGWAQANQLAVIAELTRREEDADRHAGSPESTVAGVLREPDARERVSAEVGCALSLSPRAAGLRVHLATELNTRLPWVCDALQATSHRRCRGPLSRCATGPAASPAAGDPPRAAIVITPSPIRRGARARATCAASAARTTG